MAPIQRRSGTSEWTGTYSDRDRPTVTRCDPDSRKFNHRHWSASDVDCAGGSGNGPAYVQGPVQVIGSDIYGLDRDKDGIGCES